MKRNAYNFSNDLARISGALSKAMLGNASDDAAIALANYRDAQTASTEQDTKQTGLVNTARNALINQPQYQAIVANAMGLDTISPQFMGAPSSSQMRLGTPAASNLAQTFLGSGGTAQQMANAAKVFGDAGASRVAESMIFGGDADAIRRGAIAKGLSPTKYFDAGTAQSDIANTLTAALDKNQTTLTGKKDETEAKFGEGGQGDRDKEADNLTEKAIAGDLTAAKERWNKYKARRELEASKYGDDVQAGVDRDKNKAADATVRYRHDNRTVEFTVEPGKILVIDPVSAKKAGIKIQTEGDYKGLYILDGGEKLGDVKVTVGKGDVYMSEAMADALGVETNADGQRVIKGAGFKDSSSSDGSGSGSGGEDSLDLQRYNKEWRDTVQFYPAFADVPNHAEAAMKKMITEQIKRDMKPPEMVNGQNKGGRGMSYTEAYAANADVTVGAGSMRVGSYGSRFFIPKFYFDAFVSGNQKNDAETRVISFFRSNLGYSQAQSEEVAKEILAARR